MEYQIIHIPILNINMSNIVKSIYTYLIVSNNTRMFYIELYKYVVAILKIKCY